ncbi:MAG TPA: DEAD/DEAH box helicase [bacterium]
MTAPLHDFPYDPFQQRAIDSVDCGHSLFVAAPTGAGKTVLADYVIERTMARGQRVIYTAPIKALSNQKFRDFSARHGEQVGIMTGDVTINPAAPLVIMTTEIYRNSLLENPERFARYAWIIFDEIHYLDDPERGTVWEEAIMFTPVHINLLCLSATIPNVAELAQWIRDVHQRPVDVVEETARPVPLSIVFQSQNAILPTLKDLKRVGYRGEEDWRHIRRHERHRLRTHARGNRITDLVQHLAEQQHLPSIYFTFGRRRAEDLAWELSGLGLLSDQEHERARRTFAALCARFQLSHDRTAQALGHLIDHGIAYHHAGVLPTMKEVIERCFSERIIKVIVTTETFALGVNMPARSVVLDTLKKRTDGGFALLRRREFLQMAGRAGRRGMDAEGFVYLRINPHHVTYPEVQHVLQARPESVRSRFNMAYATLLNLYRKHGMNLLNLFPKTFYAFQTTGARREEGLDVMRRKLALLDTMGYLTAEGLTARGEFASWLYGYELLLTELHAGGRMAPLDVTDLAVLLLALVYEPKPGVRPPKLDARSERLGELCREPLRAIHRFEHKYRAAPGTTTPAFHLTRAMEAWLRKTPFPQLSKFTDVDEGELVRYFRMTVQLLRQLIETPAGDPALRATAAAALSRINRDVVDAEAQLRMG